MGLGSPNINRTSYITPVSMYDCKTAYALFRLQPPSVVNNFELMKRKCLIYLAVFYYYYVLLVLGIA